jgi:hypothetical protein
VGYFAIPRFFYIFAKNKYKTITMSKEELIEHYEILYAKKIKTLKSFKDGDFFKITSNKLYSYKYAIAYDELFIFKILYNSFSILSLDILL